MKTSLALLAAAVLLVNSAMAAPGLSPEAKDTLADLLKKQTGQRVELRLCSGEKISGKVESVGEEIVHLSALTGMELFEAAVAVDEIEAIVVRMPAN
jgi:hypothetical protein